MTEHLDRAALAAFLRDIQSDVSATVAAMSPESFERAGSAEWSAADYLKHLILSVKPFARALGLPPARLADMFGAADRPSLTYDELVAMYSKRIDEGIRAEQFPAVTPLDYRLPPDTTDLKAALLSAWNDGNDRLIAALGESVDDTLDAYVVPHPAIGLITLREMLYFTVHHNRLHARDIERVARPQP